MTDPPAHPISLGRNRGAARQSRVSRSTSQTFEQLGGPGVGQGLGQLVAPGLVFSLEGAELVDGIGPPLGRRTRSGSLRRTRTRRSQR